MPREIGNEGGLEGQVACRPIRQCLLSAQWPSTFSSEGEVVKDIFVAAASPFIAGYERVVFQYALHRHGRHGEGIARMTRVDFADSRSQQQLKLCDLVAGATAGRCRQFLGDRQSEDYVDQLGSAGIQNPKIGWIWPKRQVDPENSGMEGWSGEAVGFLSEQFAQLMTRSQRLRTNVIRSLVKPFVSVNEHDCNPFKFDGL